MKISKLIKEEFQKLIKELSVDEPKGGPFGKVLFSPDRGDKVDTTEPNTGLEDKFYNAFQQHQEEGRNETLFGMFDDLLKIAKSGKYKNLIQPPKNTYVYRISTGLTVSTAASYLGMSEEELMSYSDGSAYYVPLNGKQYRSRAKIQSWTLYPSPETFSGLNLVLEEVAILFEANTSNNDFIINPKLSSVVPEFSHFANEYETVARSPIKLTGASFMVLKKKVDSSELNDLIEKTKKILSTKEIKQALLKHFFPRPQVFNHPKTITKFLLKSLFQDKIPDLISLFKRINELGEVDFIIDHKGKIFSRHYKSEESKHTTHEMEVVNKLIDAANTKKYAKKPK